MIKLLYKTLISLVITTFIFSFYSIVANADIEYFTPYENLTFDIELQKDASIIVKIEGIYNEVYFKDKKTQDISNNIFTWDLEKQDDEKIEELQLYEIEGNNKVPFKESTSSNVKSGVFYLKNADKNPTISWKSLNYKSNTFLITYKYLGCAELKASYNINEKNSDEAKKYDVEKSDEIFIKSSLAPGNQFYLHHVNNVDIHIKVPDGWINNGLKCKLVRGQNTIDLKQVNETEFETHLNDVVALNMLSANFNFKKDLLIENEVQKNTSEKNTAHSVNITKIPSDLSEAKKYMSVIMAIISGIALFFYIITEFTRKIKFRKRKAEERKLRDQLKKKNIQKKSNEMEHLLIKEEENLINYLMSNLDSSNYSIYHNFKFSINEKRNFYKLVISRKGIYYFESTHIEGDYKFYNENTCAFDEETLDNHIVLIDSKCKKLEELLENKYSIEPVLIFNNKLCTMPNIENKGIRIVNSEDLHLFLNNLESPGSITDEDIMYIEEKFKASEIKC